MCLLSAGECVTAGEGSVPDSAVHGARLVSGMGVVRVLNVIVLSGGEALVSSVKPSLGCDSNYRDCPCCSEADMDDVEDEPGVDGLDPAIFACTRAPVRGGSRCLFPCLV